MSLFSYVEDKSHKGTEEVTNYEVKGKNNSKILFDFEYVGTFEHGDKLTNLIKARIVDNYVKGNTILPDSAKYICFEIPTYITLEELLNEKVFDILDQIGKFEKLQFNRYNHIGIIDRLESHKYELYKPTNEVIKYVQGEMNEQIKGKEVLFSKRLQQQEFKARISEPAKRHIKQNEQINEKRKQNPFIEEELRYKIEDKIYTNYKATDIVEGKILRINRLNKVDENSENTLYSAFLEKIESKSEEELINLQALPQGFPIIFTLSSSIDEIINSDKKNIEKFLQLISDLPIDKLNVNDMQYIGSINAEGNIQRDIESCSQEVRKKIEEEKQKYKKLKEEELMII